MLSRSAAVKLKAIFIIDLIIIGAAAGSFFYLQSEGMLAQGAKPAKFALQDLTISPMEANVGDSVAISVNVTNVGNLAGNDTVNFEINGTVKDIENLTLAAGDSEIVLFNDAETKEGGYTVRVGDLTGNFTITPAPPESSKIILSNLQTDPYEVWVNDTVTIIADAQNPSTADDKLRVAVTVDNVVVETSTITVAAETTQAVAFNVTATTEGQHTVKLNTLSGSFTVVKTGYHTVEVTRSGGGSTILHFTLDGQDQTMSYIALLPVGQHSVSVPSPVDI